MKNILVILSDQQRQDTMGIYGQKLDVTPNLDRLAKESTIFDNAFTPQPVCGPARACIQTGKYPSELGTFVNGISLPTTVPTLASLLKNSGYKTGYVGKWHLASDDGENEYHYSAVPLEKRGGYIDYWMASDVLEFTSHGYDGYVFNKDMEKVEFKGYRADKITDFALDFLKVQEKESPFLLFVSYIEPHHQNDRKAYEGPKDSKEKFKDFELPEDIKRLGYGDSREQYPDYLGCCNAIDRNVGRMLDVLEEKNLLEDTIVVYSSDHGCHFKTRNKELKKPGADDYKRSPEDCVIKIPMIIHGIDYLEKGREKTFVSLLDLTPTLLDAVGVKPDASMQGIPIREKLKGETNRVFIQVSESFVGRAIRTERFLYFISAPDKNPWKDKNSLEYEETYLYDLEKDPLQLNNLINDESYKEIKEELKKLILADIFKYEGIEGSVI